MKYIPEEDVVIRQSAIGNPPLSDHDLAIATYAANFIANLSFIDEISAAIITVEAVRHYDQDGKIEDAEKVIEWYREKEKGANDATD